MQQRSLFPLFDAAYLGLTSGDFDADAFAIRHFVHEKKMEAGICLSFAKNMGLYGKQQTARKLHCDLAEKRFQESAQDA